MIHKRGKQWDGLPWASLDEIADFADEFAGIVGEALPSASDRLSISIDYKHGESGWMTPDELRNSVPELPPISDATEIFFLALPAADGGKQESQSVDKQFSASVVARPSLDGWRTMLSVKGDKVTAVEGVKGALTSAIEKHFEERQRLEKVAETERLQEESAANTAAVGVRPQRHSGLRAVLFNPWVVTIGGGIVAGLIILLVR